MPISYSCTSQTGEGFEELVNTINSEEIKRKVKKVIIADTSYLYRHNISQFSGYCDVNIPTEWYLKNKEAIEKLTVDFELKSCFTGLQKGGFNDWYKQIKKDFVNDIEFKNAVIDMENSALLKSDGSDDIGKNIDFILEEAAYTCLNFSNVNMLYPMAISTSVKMAIKKYNLNVHHLYYTISWHAQENKASVLDRNEVNNEIIKFITRDATNVNFFVIGKNGDIIYKNSSLSTVVTEWNAKDLDQQTWDNSLLVMKEKKQMIFEETDKHKDFLSVKAPLVIDGKVEGVIGLAVDITDRKKAEELEKKLAIVKELYEVERMLVDDICSPGLSLYMLHELCKDR
ncbi:MAG: hypothetical protein LBU10_06150, partial [Endomicrobium sp.]|nr:hypothetical protein [Endomicrobium sp.]